MATRATIEAQIADDLIRSDLTNQIRSAVDAAIRAYRFEPLRFNEAYRSTATLSISTVSLALTAITPRFRRIHRLRVVRNANDYLDLYQRDYDWIMARQDAVIASMPLEYCIYNDTVHFDSMADQTYTLYLDGIVDVTGAGTTNTYSQSSAAAWFNDGRELIRHRARREVYAHVIKDFEMASAAKGAEDEALRMIKAEHAAQAGKGFVTPTEF